MQLGFTAYNNTPSGPALSWQGSVLEDKLDQAQTNYRRARAYDPATGRFTQEDPVGLAGGLNAYGFAGGDPINYDDPFGLCPAESETWCTFGDLISGVFRALFGAPTRLVGNTPSPAGIVNTVATVADIPNHVTPSVDVQAGPVSISVAPDALTVAITPTVGLSAVGSLNYQRPGTTTVATFGGLIGDGGVVGGNAGVDARGHWSSLTVSGGLGVDIPGLSSNALSATAKNVLRGGGLVSGTVGQVPLQ